MREGGHDPRLVEDRRANAADQAAGLGVGLAKHRHRGMEGVGGLFRTGILEMVEGIELHDRAGQFLGQTVVDLVGDQLALVVARLEKVPGASDVRPGGTPRPASDR